MVATFQSAVNIWSAAGVVGELAFDGPMRAAPYNLFSNGVPNLVGNAYTVTSGGSPEPVGNSAIAGTAQVGGTGYFAGILICPKDYASYGTTGTNGPLAPTMVLPDYSIGQLAITGEFWVNLPGPANIGDLVTYDPLTGNLNSIAPTTKFTASIAATAGGDVMTVSAVSAGQLAVGQPVFGAGVKGGTTIAALGTGTGGTGTYILNTINLQTVSSEAMTSTNQPAPAFAASSAAISGTTLTITTLTSGELTIGTQIFGTGVLPNTVITAFGSGTGGTGTYTVNNTQTVSAEAMTGPSNLFVPSGTVSRFTTNTGGGLAVIKI